MSFTNSSQVIIRGQNTFNHVHGNQVNGTINARGNIYFNTGQPSVIRSEYDEFRDVRRGDTIVLKQIHSEDLSDWDWTWNCGMVSGHHKTRRTTCICRVYPDQRSNFTAVMYEGEDAQTAWEEDFRQFSRVGRNLDGAQLFAINQSDIPMLIFHRELVPLAHFYTESFWMQMYIAHLLKNNGLHECNLWMDTSRGALQRGPKGPSVAYSRPWTDDSIVVPSTVDMLKAETTIKFFRKFGQGIDNVVLRHAALHRRTRTLGQPSLDPMHDADPDIVGQKFQASNFWRRVPHQLLARGIAWLQFDTIYSPSLDPVARWSQGSEFLWKCTRCVGLSDMNLVERDTIRFRLNDTQEETISVQFEYNWRLFQETWLSQSTRVLDALRSAEDNYFCTNPPMTLGFETIKRCRYCKDAPTMYLFVRFPTTISELKSWKEVNPYFWSHDKNGQTKTLGEDCTKWRLPKLHSYFRRDQRVALQSWPKSTYSAIRDWQKAQGFDPSTSDWARSIGFPEMEIIGIGARGDEEDFEFIEEVPGANEDWEILER